MPSAAGHSHERVAGGRDRLRPAVGTLVRHAQRAGVLRDDVSELDIGIAVAVISRVGGPERSESRERYVTLVLDGLVVRRDVPSPLTPVSASEDDLACMVAPGRRQSRDR